MWILILREGAAPRIADIDVIAALVGAHPPRRLRPRERRVEIRRLVGLVHLALCGVRFSITALFRRQLEFHRLAGLEVALVDEVQRHQGPPGIAGADRLRNRDWSRWPC